MDRIAKIDILNEHRSIPESHNKIDLPRYTETTFSMFSGQIEKVSIMFHNKLMGVVVDRFGKEDIMPMIYDKSHFSVSVNVSVSPQFFGWLFGLDSQVKILHPQHVADKYAEMLNRVRGLYAVAE